MIPSAEARAPAASRLGRWRLYLPARQAAPPDPTMELTPDSWAGVFAPETPLLELLARGAALYFGILVFLRVMPRRSGGELTTMDLIFVLLVAEAATHAMGGYTSVADGLVLIASIMGWNYLVNALSYRVPAVERWVSAPPLQVVRDGRLLRRNMRREYLTEEELMGHLRRQGIDDLGEVEAAFVEGEGQVTAVRRTGGA